MLNAAHSTAQNYPIPIARGSYTQMFSIQAKLMSTATIVHYQMRFDTILSDCIAHLVNRVVPANNPQDRTALSKSLLF